MLPLIGAAVLGFLLGWGGAHALFLGSWTLLPWGLAGLALGYWVGRRRPLFAGALYGFILCFVFMVAGYTGSAPTITRVPFFALIGLFGAVCGMALTFAGARLKTNASSANS
jgi:hypothetical protein